MLCGMKKALVSNYIPCPCLFVGHAYKVGPFKFIWRELQRWMQPSFNLFKVAAFFNPDWRAPPSLTPRVQNNCKLPSSSWINGTTANYCHPRQPQASFRSSFCHFVLFGATKNLILQTICSERLPYKFWQNFIREIVGKLLPAIVYGIDH